MLPSVDMSLLRENEIKIQEAAIRYSEEVKSGGKQIRMIKKQHRINCVSFAGNGWFDSLGRWFIDKKPKVNYKYKIEYTNKINNDEHLWCFN